MLNWRIMARLLGLLIMLLGASMIFSAAWGFYYGERDAWAIVGSMAVCALTGGSLFFMGRGAPQRDVNRREGLAMVGLGWLVGAAFAALPFVLAVNSPGFTGWADAYFESMSGLTTTGASILSDIEANSRCILFWRSFTHWLGGMGIIVLFVAIMPFLGVGGRQLFKSEVPGPTPEGLQPKILHTARILWYIYIGISALETIALMICGMDLFDSLCHTFGTMATGGFSTKNMSVAQFHSAPIDMVITLFMFAAGLNFALYFIALRGQLKQALNDPELKIYAALVGLGTLAVTINLMGAGTYDSIWSALRYSVFQVVSVQTTTGFGTANFDTWPPFSKILLVALMFVGGCAGSTGGGMKVVRIAVIAKYAMQSVVRTYHPEAVLTVRMGRTVVPRQVVGQILGFFACAMALFVGGSLVVAAFGHDVVTSTTSVAATLWNIGPGLARVGSVENYGFFHPAVKIFLSILMAMGRLELFTILVLFSPAFWRR
jgi:trk system potassium uptake protein TrkH